MTDMPREIWVVRNDEGQSTIWWSVEKTAEFGGLHYTRASELAKAYEAIVVLSAALTDTTGDIRRFINGEWPKGETYFSNSEASGDIALKKYAELIKTAGEHGK